MSDPFRFDFDSIRKAHEHNRQEWQRCASDPPMRSAEVGDRVLVNALLVNRGFEWIRLEGKVVEVADTAYRVEYADEKHCLTGGTLTEWVHRFAVTDVLGK